MPRARKKLGTTCLGIQQKVILFSELIGVHSEVDTLQKAPRKKDWEPQDRQQTGGGDVQH